MVWKVSSRQRASTVALKMQADFSSFFDIWVSAELFT